MTTERPIEQQAIGQIAVDLPGATAIFRRLKLDFCCGGQVPLAQACASKGLDTATVLAELAGLQRQDQAPDTQDPAALIDHILTRYHAVHREQLPELITTSLSEYEARAVELASDRQQLLALRERLLLGREQSLLFDMPRFVRSFEEGLQQVYSRLQTRK